VSDKIDSTNLQKDFNLIIVKCALIELLYIGHTFEKEIVEDNDELEKYKSLFMSYYVAKETNWREMVIIFWFSNFDYFFYSFYVVRWNILYKCKNLQRRKRKHKYFIN